MMGEPRKKTDYRAMTLAEMRVAAEQLLGQAAQLHPVKAVGQVARQGAGRVAAAQSRGAAAITANLDNFARQARETADRLTATPSRLKGNPAANFENFRRQGQDFLARVDAAPARARRNLQQNWARYQQTAAPLIEGVRKAAETAREAPGRAFDAYVQGEVADGRKYFTEINPYRRDNLLTANRITDPNSAAAREVMANEKRYTNELYASRKAEWDAVPGWAQPFRALHYGAEHGAFSELPAIERARWRNGGRQEDVYQAERLPYTFALEDHPLAYAAGNFIGSLAADGVTRGAAGPAGAALEGYLSEPGDTTTRIINAGTGVVADKLGDRLAKPLEKYVQRAINSAQRRAFAPPPLSTPGARVGLPYPSGAPLLAPPVVKVTPPPSPMARQAHFEGQAEPAGGVWNFSGDPAAARYGPRAQVRPSANAAAPRLTLQSNLETLRPDASPTLAEHGFYIAPEIANELTEVPVAAAVDPAMDHAADEINDWRASWIEALRRERAARPALKAPPPPSSR